MSERELKVFAGVKELNDFAANEFAGLAREAIQARGRFTVALSGGSTPKKLYALLASDKFGTQIEWHKIHFFFGDERFVAPDSEESNYRMANESLFSRIKIPAANIHRFPTEKGDARTTAESAAKALGEIFNLQENEFPRFDLILLGIGADGHTASLFPETDALQETQKIIVENYVSKFQAFRLTFTFPTINNARNIIFLIAGEDKAEILKEILENKSKNFPAQFVEPINGKLQFLVDEKAASLLKN